MAQTGTLFSMRFNTFRQPIIALAALAVCLFSTTFVLQASVNAVENNAVKDTGLRITPLRSKPVQNPGATTSGSVTITNTTNSPMAVALSVERFQTIDEDYNYSFFKGEHSDWVRLTDKSVTLEPKASKTVPYSLAVPSNASPSGYYFAVFASTENKPSATNFIEVKRVSSLIYLEVSGDLKKSVSLLGTDASWLLISHNLHLVTRLHNQGNTHYPSRTKIEVRGILGWPKNSTQKDALVLPNTIRRTPTTVPFPAVPGVYRVGVSFTPPQGGPAQVARVRVLYTPVWFLVVMTLIVIGVLYRLTVKHQRRRRYKRTTSN